MLLLFWSDTKLAAGTGIPEGVAVGDGDTVGAGGCGVVFDDPPEPLHAASAANATSAAAHPAADRARRT
jgi:hypothetical protein